MFITPALAGAAGTGASGGDPMGGFGIIAPMLIVVAIFYFIVFRPQQERQKQQREKIAAVRRGDTVVTTSGFVGKVVKVYENTDDIEVELNDQMRVRVVRSTLLDVRSKGEPVKA